MINVFQPSLDEKELLEIQKVIKSNWLGKGNYVKIFEEKFADSLKEDKAKFLSTTSCTEAIFLSADLFKFDPNDEIIVPSISFPSIGNAVVKTGARIIFSDVDSRSLNVRACDIEHLITNRTKALYVTHYAGVPCDMDPIVELCNKHNIKIIEDSACAVRSFYKGKACGTIGDMGMWSFDAMKTLSTADGGMIYVKAKDLRAVAEELSYLGLPIKQKTGLDSSANNNTSWWEFELNMAGRRGIMNNLTASIGLVQLDKLDGFIKRRKEIYDKYYNELANCEWLTLPPSLTLDYQSSYYSFWIQLAERNKLAKYLLDNGVYTTFRYWPLHKVNFFKDYVNGEFPQSDRAAATTLNIPLHQSLSDEDVNKIINLIKSFKTSLTNA